MNFHFTRTFILSASFVFGTSAFGGRALYVSPQGSGSTCSQAAPCSLQGASPDPGDTVYLGPGPYVLTSQWQINSNGTLLSPIKYQPLGVDRVTIDTRQIPTNAKTKKPQEAIYVNGEYVTLSRLDIIGGKGVAISVNESHVNILGSSIHDACLQAVYIGRSDGSARPIEDVTIADNVVERNSRANPEKSPLYRSGEAVCEKAANVPATILATGDGGSIKNISFMRNIVDSNSGEALDFRGVNRGTANGNTAYDNYSVAGVYLDAASNITVSKNYIFFTGADEYTKKSGNSGIASANEPGSSNHDSGNIIVNNIVLQCRFGFDLFLADSSTDSLGLDNYRVYNNTFALSSENAIHIQSSTRTQHEYTVFENNVFDVRPGSALLASFEGLGAPGQVPTGISFALNCWSPKNSKDLFPRTFAVIGDPMFSGPPGNGAASYTLSRQSACAGTAIKLPEVPTDFFGRERPAADDFGAITDVTVTPPSDPIARGNIMEPGQHLPTGQSLISSSGMFKLTMQADGNLVLYVAAHPLWSSNTAGQTAINKATLSADGTFALQGAGVHILIAGGLSGVTRLIVQDDGNVVIYKSDDIAAWATNTRIPIGSLAAGTSGMFQSQVLYPGQQLVSADGHHTLRFQQDGTLKVFAGEQPLRWETPTRGKGAAALIMQKDGNLVLYSVDGQALWASNTSTPGSLLILQDDGNAVVYNPAGQAAWASGT